MNFRTDLALESTEPAKQVRTEQDGCVLTRIDDSGKTYVTMEVQAISDHIDSDDSLLKLVASELEALLPQEGMILAAGLGNRSVTPDALGPLAAEEVLATRYIKGELARVTGLDGLRPVAVISPGVLGCTGMEAFEVLRAVVGEIKPAAVVTVDAGGAEPVPPWVYGSAQLRGVSPGSGVGNSRPRIDRETLGVPVVSMGIPTVVDAATLASDLLGRDGPQDKIAPRGASMMVTPREVDLIIKRGARLLAMGINRAVNPSLSVEEFEELT